MRGRALAFESWPAAHAANIPVLGTRPTCVTPPSQASRRTDKWLRTDPAGHLFEGLTYLLQAAQEWQCQRDLRLQLGGYQVQVYAMDSVFLCVRSLFEFFMGEGRRRRIDPGLGRGNHLCADLGANGRVDQRPHRLGERLVDGAQPGHVVGGEVLQGPVQHTRTRTRSSAGCRVTPAPGRPAADGSPGGPTRSARRGRGRRRQGWPTHSGWRPTRRRTRPSGRHAGPDCRV